MSRTLFFLLAVLCAGRTLIGDEPKGDYEGPIVVLKNGAVLRGKGTNLGEKILVELTDGGEVKLTKGQVEIIANSLSDAYLQKREKLLPENVLSQINLAYWCLDQGLQTEAEVHARAAKKLDPTHPGINRLQRKINELAKASEEELPEKVDEAPPTEDLKELLKRRMESARRDSIAETGEISPATKLKFNKEVQPILLGSCAASKCHGPNSENAFRLVRSSPHSDNHALFLRRNQQSVIAKLNVATPEESPLLEMAATKHGPGMKAPALDVTSREFSVLVDWVIAASDDLNRPKSGAAAPVTGNAATSKPPATISPSGYGATNKGSSAVKDESDESHAEGGGKPAPRVADRTAKGSAKKGAKSPAPREEEESPGDPGEFNERYFPRGPR